VTLNLQSPVYNQTTRALFKSY